MRCRIALAVSLSFGAGSGDLGRSTRLARKLLRTTALQVTLARAIRRHFVLDKSVEIYQKSARSGSDCGPRICTPPGSFALFRPKITELTQRRRQKEAHHEIITSDQNINSTDPLHTGAGLLWVFTRSASSCPVAGRVLFRVHDRGGVRCASTPHHGRWKHRTWLAFALFQ